MLLFLLFGALLRVNVTIKIISWSFFDDKFKSIGLNKEDGVDDQVFDISDTLRLF